MTQSTNLKLDLLSATDLFDTDKIKSNFEKIDSNVLIPTKIIDNCVTDNSLLPLSAKQGKLLQDQITKLNGDLDAKITKGQFIVKVQENIQKIITSQSDIVRGTLPSKMMNCAYAAVGFSELVDNELSIVVDGNSIIVSPKKSNNAVTINWFQFN